MDDRITITEWLCAVWSHLATLATGGTVMAIVALTEWKTKKKINWWIYGFIFFGFLFTAFFQAWQDQALKRIAAENDDNFYRQESAYRQKRIESLQDAILKDRATNKIPSPLIAEKDYQSPIVQGNQASNININTDYSRQSQVSVAGDNNGNIANLQNSPNASVNQSIVNPLPKPHIERIQITSLNVTNSTDGINVIYKTQFEIRVRNPRDAMVFHYKKPSSLISEPTFMAVGSGQFWGVSSTFFYTAIQFTFLTFQKVQESDFGTFSITVEP
jgi:hypothetical protein